MSTTYTTVDSIVLDVLNDLGEETTHMYQRYLGWALRAVKEYSYDCAQDIKTVRLTMSPAKTVNLPLDYINYVKVGIVVGDKVKTFRVNTHLENRLDVDECGNPLPRETDTVHDSISNHPFFDQGYLFTNYNGNGVWGYGGSCGNIGYCSIDREHNQIQFSSEVSTTDIYLEYITNGINLTGETTVDQFAEDMINLYVHWQITKFIGKRGRTDKVEAEREFYRAKRILNARMNPFSLEDFLAATQKSYRHNTQQTHGFISPKSQEAAVAQTVEPCGDVFPVEEVETAPPGFKKIYWGTKKNPLVDTSDEILTLESEFFEDRLITKTFNATGSHYLYFAYPVAYGQGSFVYNGFPNIFLETIVVGFTDTYGTEDYYVYRSNQLQNGNNITVQII